ncbi:MAG: bifunctional diguanylate cyclase/phosphodiesterase [Chromatiaceae bacterium]|nr:bifunctional diguanylate cyclase/phosphodiesterase [Chromatiaceae bacterium]
MVVLAGIANFMAGVFVVFMAVRTPGAYVGWIDGGLYVSVILLCGVVIMIRAVRGGPQGWGWSMLGAGVILYAMGEVWWTVQGRGREESMILPPEDILWLAYYPFQVIALWLLIGANPRRRRNLHDALVVSGGLIVVLAVLIQWWLSGIEMPDPEGSLLLKGIYVTGDLVLIALSLMLVYVHRLRVSQGWWLIILSFLAFSLADTLYWVLMAYNAYVEGSWLDIGWLISTLALAWAAILGLDTVQSTPALSLQGMFPSSLAVMVSVLTLGWGPEGPFGEFARYAAVATMALSLFRLNYAIRDAAEAREQRRRAFTDQLTGLPNRFALQALVEMSGKEFVSPTGWSLLVLDIDRIKDVNNTLGHEGGDSLIAMVAERLNGCLRPGDVLARLDGDQFAMLARLADPPQPFAGAERLTTVLEKPFELNGVAVALTACVGVSGTIDPVPAIGILLKEADLAMHHAKSEGPGLIHAFTGLESVSSLQRLRMRAALRADLASGGAGFELHYQPIVRIDHTSVFALEALVRWRHAGSLVPPGQFLGEVQYAGLMAGLTSLVIHRAIAGIQHLARGHAVTVNIPPDLVTPWLLDQVKDALDKASAPPRSLIVEVTEDALIRNPKMANEVLRALRAHGVRVLLDDFGSGWCGLSSIRDLSVDGLKIARAFVSRIHRDAPTRAIASSIIDLGRNLGLIVIGEGVEDDGENAELIALGVEYVQGFAFSRPMPEANLAAYLAQHPPFERPGRRSRA